MGKGANAIVSMLQHNFEVDRLGERRVHLFADNCAGQNKNFPMVQYLLHRVMAGLHDEITLSFMIAGHTKFSPVWCFGLWKKRYQRTQVAGFSDLVVVVNQSSSVNVAQTTSQDEGLVLGRTYNWQS